LLLGGGRQPGLHQAVAEVDLVQVHLQGNEEEGVPEDGVGVTLPHQHVVGETLGQELVAVVEVDAHPDQDRQQGEQQSSDEELFDGFQVGRLGGGETKESDGNGEEPGPLPEKRLGHKELLQLKDKDVEPVEDVGTILTRSLGTGKICWATRS